MNPLKIYTYERTLLSVFTLCLVTSSFAQQMRGDGSYQMMNRTITPDYEQAATTQPIKGDQVSGTFRAPCVDTLLFEDFQTQVIPATWSNIDNDGATDANGRPQDWYISMDAQTTLPGDTNYVATASSWFSPFGVANNWLIITDPLAPCPTTVLDWWSAPFEGLAFMDGYKVLVSTTTPTMAAFTDTIFVAAEDVGGGAGTPGPGNVHTNFNGNNGVLENWQVSLGAYDGQTIFIAFVHDSNDDNLIMIDNIFAGTIPASDISVSNLNKGTEYAMTPLLQAQTMMFSGDITAGADSAHNPTLNVELFAGATSVFTDAPTLPVLAGGATATFTTSGFTPSFIENYMVTFDAVADETDPDSTNNSGSAMFAITDTAYSRADSTFDGALSIGAGSAGFLGNAYEVFTTTDLTSISFLLTAPTMGDTVYAAVYDMSGGTPNAVIASTNPIIITDTTANWYTLPIIGGSVTLSPATYVVGVQESTSGGVTLATNSSAYVPGTAWVFFSATWSNNEAFGFLNAYNVIANMSVACVDPVADYTQSAGGAAVTFTDVSLTSNTITNWLWDFGDGNTSTMQNPTHTYAGNGAYTVCLTVTDACGTDSTCQTVTIMGVNVEENWINNVSVYPVPSSDQLTVANIALTEDFTIELINQLGQVVLSKSFNGTNQVTMDISNYPAGQYQLNIRSIDQVGSKSIVIIR